MKESKKRNRRKNSFWVKHFWLCIFLSMLGCIALLFGILFILNASQTFPMRQTMVYQVVIRIVISGVILFFTFFKEKKMPVHSKIVLVLAALMLWYPLVLSSRQVLLLVQLVTVHLVLADFLYLLIFKDERYTTLSSVAVLGYLSVLLAADDYTFVQKTGGFHFWEIILSVSVLVTAVFALLVCTGRTKLTFKSVASKIVTIPVAFLMTVGTGYFVTYHLNYALDTEEPEVYRLEIVDKDIYFSSRPTRTKYILVLDAGEQDIEMHVSDDFYNQKEIGDYTDVLLYDGFFGEAFYIVE